MKEKLSCHQNRRTASTLILRFDTWSIYFRYQVKFTQLTQATDSIPQASYIKQEVANFIEFILQVANQSVPKSSPESNSRKIPWWTRNRALNQFRTPGNPNELIKFKRPRAKARVLLRFSKK